MFRHVAGFRIFLLVLATVSCAFAQRDLSTLTGTVTDPTGAAIANAKVTLIKTQQL